MMTHSGGKGGQISVSSRLARYTENQSITQSKQQQQFKIYDILEKQNLEREGKDERSPVVRGGRDE